MLPNHAPPPAELPPIVSILGYAGLLPFVALAAASWALDAGLATKTQQLQLVYAAVILSFLGAVHWGIALQQRNNDPKPFIWGVIPSLLGWLAVALPAPFGAHVASVGLILCWLADRQLLLGWPLARAYGRLRTRLTLIAWLSLIAGRLASSG